jgi:Uncharacterized protein conserved in bacteria
MSLESDLLKRMECDQKKLLSYGFIKEKDHYHYEKTLAIDEMKASFDVDQKGILTGKVLDPFSEDEYIAIHLPRQKGAYVSKVRGEYLAVLSDIAKHCYHKVPFIFPQTNRINALIQKKYKISCEFPFTKYPHIGAYYHPANRKWFGLIQCLDRSTFLPEKGECEVLNLKINGDEIPSLLEKDGFFEGYHMSKKSWISILLDDTVSDDVILNYVEESYQLTSGGVARQGRKEWIIPANPNYFDLDHAYEQTDEIYWKQTAKMVVGDLVYMYYGAPYSQIRYLCVVTAIDIPADIDGKVRIRKMMRIKKLYRFQGDKLDRRILKKHGVVSVRGPRYIPEDLVEEIETIYPESKKKKERL